MVEKIENVKDKLAEKSAQYPMRVRMILGIVVAVGGSAALFFGLDAAGVEEQVTNLVLTVFDLLVLAGVVKTSEGKVTPLANPRDMQGRHLKPE